MTSRTTHPDAVAQMKQVRQARLYEDRPVFDDVLHNLLEVAQWTGSSRNTQPWHFVVVNHEEQLKAISEIRTPINWVADAPLAIAIVLNGKSDISEAYDEGRVTERLLVAARLLGLGGGTAWFGDEGQQARGKEVIGVPAEMTARSVVVLGYPRQFKDHRPNPAQPGRRPLNDLVSYGTFGTGR
ncbi:MAG: nitroreductase family protein [Chloroflexia bacterium]|nr:nitroreductase family protein [Chloroflexia bacterium]